MYPYIVIFGHNFSSYSLLALAGCIAGMIYCFLVSLKFHLSFKNNMCFFLFGVPFAFIFAMLFFFITRIDVISANIEYLFSDFKYFISIVSVGFVFYGGLLGFLIGMMLYCNIFDMDMRKEFYYLVPVIPLFHVFGRIGCYLAGCCYGKSGIPIQLIEAGCNLIIFIILLFVIQKSGKTFKTVGLYFVMYGTVRFILEFFRGDEIRGILCHLSTSQWISLIVIPLGIYNLVVSDEKNHFNTWYNGK